MNIVIAKNYQIMSKLAADLVVKELKEKKRAVLGLPTGGTPLGLYENLAKDCLKKKISFKGVRTFNLDEYVGLAETDCRSYHWFMKNKLFNFIDIKAENIFFPGGQTCLSGRWAKNLRQAAAEYDGLIKKYHGLDLLILGIGLNGHIGFNEPGSDFNSKTRVVVLKRKTRLSNAKYFSKFEDVPRRAITMGLATIMKARKIILLAAGHKKSAIVKRALKGKITKLVPASILQNHKNLTVILDNRAAKDLMDDKKCYKS